MLVRVAVPPGVLVRAALAESTGREPALMFTLRPSESTLIPMTANPVRLKEGQFRRIVKIAVRFYCI